MTRWRVRYGFDDGDEFLPLDHVRRIEAEQLQALAKATGNDAPLKAFFARLANAEGAARQAAAGRAQGAQATRERAKARAARPAAETVPEWLDGLFRQAREELEREGYRRIGRDRLRDRARQILARTQLKDPRRNEITERRARRWLEAHHQT